MSEECLHLRVERISATWVKAPERNEVHWMCAQCQERFFSETEMDKMNEPRICDEPGCKKWQSCGWPSPVGYRMTCGDHMRNPGNARTRLRAIKAQEAIDAQ